MQVGNLAHPDFLDHLLVALAFGGGQNLLAGDGLYTLAV
jgi:hypothetical protein